MGHAERQRDYRKRRYLHGKSYVPALGTARRLQALTALGWTSSELAAEVGACARTVTALVHGEQGRTRRELAARTAAAFDRLCLTPRRGQFADRARRIAARGGFAPPLAWDDIDDPLEQPLIGRALPRTQAETVEEAAYLRSFGLSSETVAARLGMRLDSLQRAERQERAA